ncbi:hypothetical protein NA78x_005892 [Anatilimnocola sp. NA78]|uniref:hypothetical protein n=1 Tax=Anatilimnocola sp. NA78 TaxID=3415683 RepID=UPI003CE4599E
MVALEIVLLAAHLACMNIAAGAPLVGLWLEWKDRRGDGVAGQAANYLASATVIALLVGAVLGLTVGWLRWTPEYAHVWQVQLTHKLNNGLIQLGLSFALLVGYWIWRQRVLIPTRAGFVTRSSLLLFASTNLLYHFPPLLIVAGKLEQGAFVEHNINPDVVMTPRTFFTLSTQQDVPAMSVHFALASVAMAGLLLLGLALRRMKIDDEIRNAKRIALWGGWATFGATGLQLVVGLWLLSTTPQQAELTGSSLWPTLCLVASLALVMWLLRELADVTLGECSRKSLVCSMIAMTGVILLMTAARTLSRPQPVAASQSKIVHHRQDFAVPFAGPANPS